MRAVGGALGIAVMMTLSHAAGQPLMSVPFATSIVLVIGSPEAPPARPRAVIGGHLISASVAVACAMLFGEAMWVAVLGVGLSIAAMHALDAFHPPAGISPLIVTNAHASVLFIVSPVLTGALILVAFAFVYHRLSGERWP
ncbi:MAG: HPP family protein [Alphaproteobacteria bacterium]|nr:HPP family protein [Alphaproteobacteria bacterium]